jgi:hypothetical protein
LNENGIMDENGWSVNENKNINDKPPMKGGWMKFVDYLIF